MQRPRLVDLTYREKDLNLFFCLQPTDVSYLERLETKLRGCQSVEIFENVISVEPIKGDASQENSHCRSYL